MGVLSYTLYLVHYPILNLAEKWSDNRLVVGVSALAISVVDRLCDAFAGGEADGKSAQEIRLAHVGGH